jgi:hypothetical protein
MASELRVEVPGTALDRRRAVRYALGAVAGAVAMPVLAACGAAKTTGNSSATSSAATSSSSASKPAPLPQSTQPTWPLNVGISQVQVPGSMYATQGSGPTMQLEMAAFGNDIWNNADNCCFYGNQASGDGTWSVQVAIQSATSTWAKAGLMLRQSLDPSDVMIDLVTTPQEGVNCQYRLVKGMDCPSPNGPEIDAVSSTPVYLQMVKKGNTLTVSDSADGTTWNNVTTLTFLAPTGKNVTPAGAWAKGINAATTVPLLSDPYYVGICACAHIATLRGMDGFTNIVGLKNPTYTSIFNPATPTDW